MTIKKTKDKSIEAESYLRSLLGKDLTFGRLIASLRESEGSSLTEFAKKLKITRQNLCDIEKDRKSVNPARAARWAKTLEYSESLFVQMSLEEILSKEGLKKYSVEVKQKKVA